MFGVLRADDNNADLRGQIIGASVTMIMASGLAVGLRILARKIVRQPLLADDWLCFVALPFAWGMCGINIAASQVANYGLYLLYNTNEELSLFFKLLIPWGICWILGCSLPKLSILYFYRRIWSTSPTRLPAYILGGMIVLWVVASIPIFVFSCTPIQKFWYRLTPGQCQPIAWQLIGTAIPNMIFDIALLIFPIPYIAILQLPRGAKIAISVIFMVAGFIIIISGLRMVTIVQVKLSLDPTWALIPLGIFSTIEANIGIVCACMPSLTPVVRVILARFRNRANTPLPSRVCHTPDAPLESTASGKMSEISDEVDCSDSARRSEDVEAKIHDIGKDVDIIKVVVEAQSSGVEVGTPQFRGSDKAEEQDIDLVTVVATRPTTAKSSMKDISMRAGGFTNYSVPLQTPKRIPRKEC